MRHVCAPLVLWGLLLLASVALGGCRLGSEPPIRLYVLTPLAQHTPALAALSTRLVVIGVGPVTVPRYVDRLPIVTGHAGPELQPAAYAQWAEPLRDSLVRVLAENVSLLLGTERVVLFPSKSPGALDYQVIVEVTHFLGEIGGETGLVALWSLVGKQGKEVVARQKSSLRVSNTGRDYEALAATMSQLVATLSREIAAAIIALELPASRP